MVKDMLELDKLRITIFIMFENTEIQLFISLLNLLCLLMTLKHAFDETTLRKL